ncbi:MAG: hypothetical protein Fur0021_34530 [Candidatus Promineifilaceae bacterium]
MSKLWRILLWASYLIWVGGWGVANAAAQGEETQPGAGSVRLSVEALTYTGQVNEPGQRTFTLIVRDATLNNVSFVINDLVDEKSGAVMISSSITVDPAQVTELSQPQLFTVSINGAKEGHFRGILELLYDGQPADQPLRLPLDIVLETTPNVDAGINSKSLSLSVTPGFFSSPFGRPRVVAADTALNNVTLTLLQNGEGAATVENATVLTMRGSKGQTLPQSAVTVSTALPMTLQSQEAKTLEVVVAGRNLPADKYDGILHITVQNQDTPIQIPLTISIKDGPLLPLLLLLIGPILGFGINWWNNGGQARTKLYQDLRWLESHLATASFIQEDQQLAIGHDITRAQDKLIAGDAVAGIETLLQTIRANMEAAATTSQQFLQDELVPVRQKTTELSIATYRRKLESDLDAIQETVRSGGFASLASARTALAEVSANLEAARKMAAEMADLPASMRNEVAAKMDAAATLGDMQGILADAKASLSSGDGGDFIEGAHGVGDRETPVTEKELKLQRRASVWRGYALRLQWGRLGLTAAVYIFTLVVGFITLYANAPTFGANPEDYITIILWGIGTNLIGAQTINLSAIYSKQDAGGG